MALLVVGVVACLPEGDPPAGVRLLEERRLTGVRVSPAPGGSVLFSRAVRFREEFGISITPIMDLWQLPPGGGPPARLVEDFSWQSFLGADSLGRLVVGHHPQRSQATGQLAHELALIDPAGESIALGRAIQADLSRSRGRLSYVRADGVRVLREADGTEIRLGSERAFETRFTGDTLLFNVNQDLWALSPGATQPVLLVPEYRFWTAREGTPDLQLVAFSQPGNPLMRPPTPLSLVLVRGSTSRILMTGSFGSSAVFAPADDRIAVIEQVGEQGAQRLHVFHADREGEEIFDLAASARGDDVPSGTGTLVFRPGSKEIWCFVQGGLRIVREDGSVQALTDLRVQPWQFEDPTASPEVNLSGVSFPATTRALFSADGRFWLYMGAQLFLGRADQPEAPGLLIQERNDFPVAQVRDLGDGRRMLFWSSPPGDAGRQDLTLLDPETNQRRLLATQLGPSLVGRHRVLAMTNLAGGLADLRLIDLETAQDTLLAQNVTGFAATPCGGCDPTAPGAAVVFAVHARIPFKYDGVWRVELP